MKRSLCFVFGCCLVLSAVAQQSPNGKISVNPSDKGISVNYGPQKVLQIPTLGYEGYSSKVELSYKGDVADDYRMLSGKRFHCTNQAREYEANLGENLRLVLRLYNDGIAQTTYLIPEGTKRWMQQWTEAYEGFFPLTTTCKVEPVPSFSGIFKSADGFNNRWGYPALLSPADDVFVLLSEANIERRQSASCLYNEGERFRVTPDKNELRVSGIWRSPWRVAIIGSLGDVVESTMITDVSAPNKLLDTSWIHPGVVSWIYWAYNHGSNDFEIIKKYVDMAVTLKLPYVLIDAEWDEMKDGRTIEEAVAYATTQGVKPLIWYNSSVGWIDGAPGPKFRLNKPEDREREFAWCEKIGVAGVKIDFFSGDNQMNMDYCITLPFTRNVIGPMDYTPCAFSDSQHPHITSKAHELALTVLFESGLQHLADKPESYLAQPQAVQDFFTELPSVWDETRFVAGYPGKSAVLARRFGHSWYVAGINGLDEAQTFSLDLSFIKPSDKIQFFADAPDGFWAITNTESLPTQLLCQPRGGFVIVLHE